MGHGFNVITITRRAWGHNNWLLTTKRSARPLINPPWVGTRNDNIHPRIFYLRTYYLHSIFIIFSRFFRVCGSPVRTVIYYQFHGLAAGRWLLPRFSPGKLITQKCTRYVNLLKSVPIKEFRGRYKVSNTVQFSIKYTAVVFLGFNGFFQSKWNYGYINEFISRMHKAFSYRSHFPS